MPRPPTTASSRRPQTSSAYQNQRGRTGETQYTYDEGGEFDEEYDDEEYDEEEDEDEGMFSFLPPGSSGEGVRGGEEGGGGIDGGGGGGMSGRQLHQQQQPMSANTVTTTTSSPFNQFYSPPSQPFPHHTTNTTENNLPHGLSASISSTTPSTNQFFSPPTANATTAGTHATPNINTYNQFFQAPPTTNVNNQFYVPPANQFFQPPNNSQNSNQFFQPPNPQTSNQFFQPQASNQFFQPPNPQPPAYPSTNQFFVPPQPSNSARAPTQNHPLQVPLRREEEDAPSPPYTSESAFTQEVGQGGEESGVMSEAELYKYGVLGGESSSLSPPQGQEGVAGVKRKGYKYPESPTYLGGSLNRSDSVDGAGEDYYSYKGGNGRKHSIGGSSLGTVNNRSYGYPPRADGNTIGIVEEDPREGRGQKHSTEFDDLSYADLDEYGYPREKKLRQRHPNSSQALDLVDFLSTAPPTSPHLPCHAHTPTSQQHHQAMPLSLPDSEEDSPYPEVRASVSNIDDPEMPVLTFRSWFLGLGLCIIFVAINLFFLLRYPSPNVTVIAVQVISYPLGKLMAYALPLRTFETPSWILKIFPSLPKEWSLNPGPFNIKEHTVIVIMANVGIQPSYCMDCLFALSKFYEIPVPTGFSILFVLSSQLLGFGFAGLCRRFLVWPGSLIWPQNLLVCTLLNTFHAEEEGEGMSRYKLFGIVAGGSWIWYWFPGWIFQGLSAFSWVCWIWPKNVIVNQLFGVETGLGMSGLTFDWSQISYINSPLIVPWWAEVNIMVAFIFFYWFLTPILYYTDTWYFSYLPMSATTAFDRFGDQYNASVVLASNTTNPTFNETAYLSYSPLYMPVTYSTVYGLGFMVSTAAIVHTILWHGKSIVDRIRMVRVEEEDVHCKLMRYYPEVPDWWYWGVLVVCSALSMVMIEVYHTDLPIWGFFIAILIAAIYLLPAGFIFAMTSQAFTLNLVAEVVPGYLFPGMPIANMVFKVFCVQAMLVGLYFISDLKLGHYMKIPPRVTFMVQLIATIVTSFVQVGVEQWLIANVPDLCKAGQKDKLICPEASTFYTASIIWGLIGPQRIFGRDSQYYPQVYWLLIGTIAPIPFYFLAKRWPNSWLRHVNIPVALVGATFIPPATGINYSSWFLIGFIFQYWLRRHKFRWWSKFNFVISAGLDSGTVLAGLIIFFTLYLPANGSINFEWWGNTVYTKTYDAKGMPKNIPPREGFGPTTWA